jgi:hypothetical protein
MVPRQTLLYRLKHANWTGIWDGFYRIGSWAPLAKLTVPKKVVSLMAQMQLYPMEDGSTLQWLIKFVAKEGTLGVVWKYIPQSLYVLGRYTHRNLRTRRRCIYVCMQDNQIGQKIMVFVPADITRLPPSIITKNSCKQPSLWAGTAPTYFELALLYIQGK